MALTKDQQQAANALYHFLLNEDKTFVLSGGAGVGKTYTMNEVNKTILEKYRNTCQLLGQTPQYSQILFTATTNKAAKVLGDAIEEPVATIHSALGLIVKDNFNTGKQDLKHAKPDSPVVLKNTILFVDEASMIQSELYDAILAALHNSKVIFVGDKDQMSPIGEELSPLYKNVNPDNFVHLSEPIRNAESPALVSLCSQLRATVETGIFVPIEEVPGSVEYLSPRRMQDMLNETFSEQTDEARILCYSNARVQSYNEFIREIRNQGHDFEVGERLVAASAYARGRFRIPVEAEVEIYGVGDLDVKEGFADYNNGEPLYFRSYLVGPPGMSKAEATAVLVPEDHGIVKEVLKKIARRKVWDLYFSLKNCFADLRNKEACTVHKSQGSTYDEVFIDLGNIGTCRDPEQAARLLFVAASRARSRVWLYGQLPSQYRGVKVS